MDTSTRLSSLERWLLVLPIIGGAIFGLFPLLAPGQFAAITTGYPGNDAFIYRLAGAATLGYAVALILGVRQGTWAAVRLMVIAVLTFNLASLYTCLYELISPSSNREIVLVVYFILVVSILVVAITGWMLYRHRADGQPAPDIAPWVVRFIVVATVLAFVFGVAPLLYPQLNRMFGFKVTDIFLYHQAGAGTLGYAIMGIFELRSRNWLEIRFPSVMAAVFNGLSFLASLYTLIVGESLLLPALVGVASLAVTILAIVVMRSQGGASTKAQAAPSA
jgi:hypothetical protein